MFHKIRIVICLFFFASSVKSKNITVTLPQHPTKKATKVTVKKGEELKIIFTVASEALGCSFTSPRGNSYNMLRGAAHDQGRIQQLELNENDCAMKITNSIKKFDDGVWRSNITYKDFNGNYEIGIGKVHVIVAIPPDDVYLQRDNSRISENEKIEINIDETKKLSVDCFATGAYPAVEFNWYLNGTKLKSSDSILIKTKDNKGEDGRMTYISTLEYKGVNSTHHGQSLKCEVIHEGFTPNQINEEINMAQAQLRVLSSILKRTFFRINNKIYSDTFNHKSKDENTIKDSETALWLRKICQLSTCHLPSTIQKNPDQPDKGRVLRIKPKKGILKKGLLDLRIWSWSNYSNAGVPHEGAGPK